MEYRKTVSGQTDFGRRLSFRQMILFRRSIACGLLLLWITNDLLAEDIVKLTPVEDKGPAMRKAGQIVEYTGQSLVLRTKTNRELTIPSHRVIEIQTTRGELHRQADQRFAERRITEALQLYRQAQPLETRIWMRRELVAQQIWCCRYLGQFDRAADLFVALFRSDPTTVFMDTIPLAWRSQQPPVDLEQRAVSWLHSASNKLANQDSLADHQLAAALIAASWLLPTSRQAESIDMLRQLEEIKHDAIAHLARAQSWRAQLVTATLPEVVDWQRISTSCPESLRAGMYYLIGQGLARHQRYEQAAIYWMRVPIFFPQQVDLAVDCLMATGNALEKRQQINEAINAYREITQHYADHPLVGQAQAKLESLSPTQ